MTVGFLQSYSLLLIRTCHKRGVHAMGGMAAQIPIKNNPDANNAAIEKVSLHVKPFVAEALCACSVAVCLPFIQQDHMHVTCEHWPEQRQH